MYIYIYIYMYTHTFSTVNTTDQTTSRLWPYYTTLHYTIMCGLRSVVYSSTWDCQQLYYRLLVIIIYILYIYIYICIYTCVYIYIYTHIYTYVYIYIHTYTCNTDKTKRRRSRWWSSLTGRSSSTSRPGHPASGSRPRAGPTTTATATTTTNNNSNNDNVSYYY